MTWLRRHPVFTSAPALLLVAASVWGIKLGRLALSAGSNADYWSQPRGETGGLLYVALGDSARRASAPASWRRAMSDCSRSG